MFKEIMIACVVIAVISVGMMGVLTDMMSKYSIAQPTDINGNSMNMASFNQTQSIMRIVGQTMNKTSTATQNMNPLGFAAITIAGLDIINLATQIPDLLANMFYDISRWLGLPVWVAPLILGIIMIYIVWHIVYAIIRVD